MTERAPLPPIRFKELGDALLAKFGEEVPAGLVDILVTELVPAMKTALDADKKRESGNGGGTGGFGGQ